MFLRLLKRSFCKIPIEILTQDTIGVSKFQTKFFSDSVKLLVQGGKGGNGSISYFTSKTVRKGHPDGGDGGAGGNIVIVSHESLHDLSHLRRRTIHGNSGHNGGPYGRIGKAGGKTTIRVPCGTLIYELGENHKQDKKLITDLDENKKFYTVVRGGTFGKGNKQHLGNREQQTHLGGIGQSKVIQLQLKILADVGLVGLPNIGKSTFLAAVSRALPKIANYKFTTLKPSVGYVKFVDGFRISIADIPGIIEGAHENKGLGLQFLRHIERTKILIFMLDITAQQNPIEQYKLLQRELSLYKNNKLRNKPRIIVLNKIDCIANAQKIWQLLKNKINAKSFIISAKQGYNMGLVLLQLRKLIEQNSASYIHKQQ